MKKFKTLALTAGLISISIIFTACSEPVKVKENKKYISNAEIEALDIKGYYYSQLSDSEKRVYETLLKALREYKMETTFAPVSVNEFYRADYAIANDYTQFYWSGNYTAQETQGSVNSIRYDITDDIKETDKKIEESVDKILSGIDPKATDYEKVKYFYETIVNTVDYEENDNDQDIRSVFLDRKSVCAGYSKAFLYLCQRVDIPCIYVEGEVNDKELHAWNEVKLGGEYYGVDVTWGDPVFEDKGSQWSASQPISYTYLNVTDKDMFKTHKVDCVIEDISKTEQQFTYPACTAVEYNYYVQEGAFFKEYDRKKVGKYLGRKFADEGARSVEIKFSDPDSFNKALSDLFDEKNASIYTVLDEYYGGFANVEVSYVTDKDTNVIGISIK
ncbi:MAG: transglutaminase domain-containing protein [Clostridiales bacterium]|nr:transglutaminase domain-containing protein [Clostridiales bacterium]